jgi:Kef-type K+ transport system membrane component KefB
VTVAIVGKVGGSMIAARAVAIPWRDATVLGVLLNTRGLMELVILNVGLDIGVISRELFAMMVLMALATTLMTTPLVSWLLPASATNRSRAAAAPSGR